MWLCIPTFFSPNAVACFFVVTPNPAPHAICYQGCVLSALPSLSYCAHGPASHFPSVVLLLTGSRACPSTKGWSLLFIGQRNGRFDERKDLLGNHVPNCILPAPAISSRFPFVLEVVWLWGALWAVRAMLSCARSEKCKC